MNSAQRGMSLLEVLVAIAIVTLLGAAIQQYNSQLNSDIQRLQKRELAQITAANQLVSMRLLKYSELDNREGIAQQLGHKLRWSVTVSQVGDINIKRLDIEVFDAQEGQLLRRLSGFIGENE